MSAEKKVSILYFSDVLCIWAFLAQWRVDELKIRFGEQVELDYHFIPIFGSVDHKMAHAWAKKGGLTGYAHHVQEIASQFEHIEIHPDLWLSNTPQSSSSAHLYLKSLQILEAKGELEGIECRPGATVLEDYSWALRLAFFKDARDISQLEVQNQVAEEMQIPLALVHKHIASGEAMAALDEDLLLRDDQRIKGSPSLVFNQGRQTIYGNVGYKVIEANIQELLSHSENRASWC